MKILSQKEPKNLEYKRNLAIYETEIARALIKLKQFDKALAGLQKTIEVLTPIVEADKETTTYQYDLSMSYRLSAEAVFQKGDRAKALEFIEKAIFIIQKLKESNALRDADKNLLAELDREKSVYGKVLK